MKRYHRDLSSALALAVLPLVLSCSDPVGLEQDGQVEETDIPEVQQKPMTLAIHPSAAEIEVGQTIRLRAVLRAADGRVLDNDFAAQWSVSRPELAKITDEGYATGIAPGKLWIKAESEVATDWTYLAVRKGAGRDMPSEGDTKKNKLEEGDFPSSGRR